MRKITELAPKEFFAALYNIADEAVAYIDLIDFKKIRETVPEFTGDETEAERKEKIQKQGVKNMTAMLKNACIKYPDKTEHFLRQLVIYEAEEADKVTGIKLLSDALKVLGDESVVDFFVSVVMAAQTVSKL